MQINIQLAELARAVEWLRENFGEDFDDLLPDFMEGETDLHEIVEKLHQQLASDSELIAGIAARQEDLGLRKRRLSDRTVATKAAIGKFLRAGQLSKIELPEATYSVRDGKPKLDIVDPSAVPAEYQRSKPEPDKTLINETFAQSDDLPNWLVRTPPVDVVTARTR